MLSQIILALPLLASVAAGSQHGPRHAKHARHAEQVTRSNTAPVPIFNNALLQSRAQLSSVSASKIARRDDEFVGEKRNADGKRVRIMRRKVQACKASNGSTSLIGHEALASATVTAAPAGATGSDDGAEEAYDSAVASISSLYSEAGFPTDWAGPSPTTLGVSATATASASASAAPSVTASPSVSEAVPSASASSGSGNNMLFPVGRGIASWSTEDGMSCKPTHLLEMNLS
jgi:hypothetical protein